MAAVVAVCNFNCCSEVCKINKLGITIVVNEC